MVARRASEPSEDFVAVQIARHNEAMLIVYGAMKDGNLAAVDRVLKITREYDRYHGLALTLARRASGLKVAVAATIAPTAETLAALPRDSGCERVKAVADIGARLVLSGKK